ncbi:hypothetical protein [Nocardiopsis salina]|uniref:hypothetical protein n=1 Tax=Nocardiopsis salina TaxID=245836 RepID=UPI0012687634|nr:hypothetical protein [Nocardiopsis salina]
MSIRRSSREIASWDWTVPFKEEPQISKLVELLDTTHSVLKELSLLRTEKISIQWAPIASYGVPETTIYLDNEPRPARLHDQVTSALPTEARGPHIAYISLMGDGLILDSKKLPIAVRGLFEINGFWNCDSIDIELTAHHDVWFPYAFDGTPHPIVYANNAPNLTKAIHGIESALNQRVEPGDVTFFCEPGPEGILPPDDDEIINGHYFDVTRMKGPLWTFESLPSEEN